MKRHDSKKGNGECSSLSAAMKDGCDTVYKPSVVMTFVNILFKVNFTAEHVSDFKLRDFGSNRHGSTTIHNACVTWLQIH